MGQIRPFSRVCSGWGDPNSPLQQAGLVAARAPYSGDWLLALLITACGLRLDNEAVHIAVALKLGSEVGSPHSCRCGNMVDANGIHGLVSKNLPSHVARHHALNDCISRAFSAAGIPVKKEPAAWFAAMGSTMMVALLSNGMEVNLWHRMSQTAPRRLLHMWPLQVIQQELLLNKLLTENVPNALNSLQPMSFKSHGPLSEATGSFLVNLGRKISKRFGKPLETQCFNQSCTMKHSLSMTTHTRSHSKQLLTPWIFTIGV